MFVIIYSFIHEHLRLLMDVFVYSLIGAMVASMMAQARGRFVTQYHWMVAACLILLVSVLFGMMMSWERGTALLFFLFMTLLATRALRDRARLRIAREKHLDPTLKPWFYKLQ
jgi:FtsH-binding integral membrane protein